MRYCSKCGGELLDGSVICMKCGCMIEPDDASKTTEKGKLASVVSDNKMDSSWIPLFFGVLALVNVLWFYWGYYDILGTSACPLLGIVTSIKYCKSEKRVYSILGIIFSCVSVLIKLIMAFVWYL